LTQTVEKVKGCVLSQYGLISSEYCRKGEEITLEVKIPVGVTADIGLPFVGSGELTANGSEYRTQRLGQTYWIKSVGSGKYTFTLK
jgi:hypothetical protein